jgi:type VI secretion system protein ImpH
MGQETSDPERIRWLRAEGHRFTFEQSLWLLEQAWPEAPIPAATADYPGGRVRIRPAVSRAFPPSDVARIEPDPLDSSHLLVTVRFHGLYGIDAALPPRFIEDLSRGEPGSDPHRAFLDLFNHRFYAFFYRAWKKYRPQLHVQKNAPDGHTRRMLSVAGIDEGCVRDDGPIPGRRLMDTARLLGAHPRNAEGLEALIRAFFDDLPVAVIENVSRWVAIPSRTGLGEGIRLGKGDPIGEKIFDRSGKCRIRLGPMGHGQYRALLPGGDDAERLRRVLRLYIPDHLAYDVELRVLSDELPATNLGADESRLGYTTRLGTAENSVRTRVVEYE